MPFVPTLCISTDIPHSGCCAECNYRWQIEQFRLHRTPCNSNSSLNRNALLLQAEGVEKAIGISIEPISWLVCRRNDHLIEPFFH